MTGARIKKLLEQQELARIEEQMKCDETAALYKSVEGEEAYAACGYDAGGALSGVCGPPRPAGPAAALSRADSGWLCAW